MIRHHCVEFCALDCKFCGQNLLRVVCPGNARQQARDNLSLVLLLKSRDPPQNQKRKSCLRIGGSKPKHTHTERERERERSITNQSHAYRPSHQEGTLDHISPQHIVLDGNSTGHVRLSIEECGGNQRLGVPIHHVNIDLRSPLVSELYKHTSYHASLRSSAPLLLETKRINKRARTWEPSEWKIWPPI